MLNFEHHLPTKIFFGKGQIKNLGIEVKKYGERVLIIYAKDSLIKNNKSNSGWMAKIYNEVIKQLSGISIYELGEVEPNPKLPRIYEGIEICKQKKVDIVLGVGGGSSIDCAKAIAVGAKYEGDVWDFWLKKEKIKKALPIATILTLSATSSEYNNNSIVSNPKTREKLSLTDGFLFPKFSIIDPTFTYTCPKIQITYGIVDSMVHVFDQYFSNTLNTPLQDRFAEAILKTLIENARLFLKRPMEYDIRANIMWAAAWAMNYTVARGKIGDPSTHVMEHEVSGVYDISHAAGIAILWPRWAKYVYRDLVYKFAHFAKEVWGLQKGKKTYEQLALEGIDKTEQFFKELEMPDSFNDVSIIDDKEFEYMAKAIIKRRSGTLGTIKTLNVTDIINIFNMCLKGDIG